MVIFKEHLYDIVKLYVNQIGITIFSIFLMSAVGSIEDESLSNTLSIIVSVFSILFYLVLIYNVVWELGAKDRIRIDSGRYQAKPMKGLVMSLWANLPNFVLAGVAAIFGIIFVAGGAEWAASPFLILFMLVKFHAAMYVGVIQGLSPALPSATSDVSVFADALVEDVWFLLIPLVAVLVAHLSYWLGTKEKKLFGFLSLGSGSNNKPKR